MIRIQDLFTGFLFSLRINIRLVGRKLLGSFSVGFFLNVLLFLDCLDLGFSLFCGLLLRFWETHALVSEFLGILLFVLSLSLGLYFVVELFFVDFFAFFSELLLVLRFKRFDLLSNTFTLVSLNRRSILKISGHFAIGMVGPSLGVASVAKHPFANDISV